jgi:hypothetical protein
LEKFIVLTSVDNKGVLPFNSNGYRLENTSVSKIKITKNTIKIKENIFNSIEKISNYETGVAKVFTSLQGIVLNKTTSCPNNKIMVKYEIINEVYDTGIHFLVWSNDVILDENTLYVFKYITVDKYNDGWQLSLNPFTALEKIKKITKIKISSSFTHLSRNSSSSFLYSSYDSFYFNSNGNINCKVLIVVKKKESTFQIKVCSTLDDKPKILFLSTFERSNMFPYVPYNVKNVDELMMALIGKKTKFHISVKKVNEKLFFNVTSINID